MSFKGLLQVKSSYQPARKIKKSTVKNIVRFPSVKNQRSVLLESLLEYRFALQLEYDPEVISYEEQPRTFNLINNEEKSFKYTPDFLVYFKKGKKTFIEVKPSEMANSEKNLKIFKAFEDELDYLNSDFKVITEESLLNETAFENLKFFYRYRNQNLINIDNFSAIRNKSIHPTLFLDLKNYFDLKELYALISFGILEFNINSESFSEKTMVQFND